VYKYLLIIFASNLQGNTHPLLEMEYYVHDSQSSTILCDDTYSTSAFHLGQKFNIPVINVENIQSALPISEVEIIPFNQNRRALIIYTR
jgi:hypothetical protein